MQNYSSDGTRQERTGWRDAEISNRHRAWGFNCPAVDLDFLMVEYNLGLPVGLVEYKHKNARMPRFDHPTYRALRALADGYSCIRGEKRVLEPLPFMLVFYWPEDWSFIVHPCNDTASKAFESPEAVSEHEYVLRLYRLRRLHLSRSIEGQLNRTVAVAEESAA